MPPMIDAIDKQVDAYQELIDKKRELLEQSNDELDHEQEVADLVAEIAELQSKIAQLSLDDSREAAAKHARQRAGARDVSDVWNTEHIERWETILFITRDVRLYELRNNRHHS